MNDLLQRGATLSKREDAPSSISTFLATAYEQIGGGYYSSDGKNPFSWTDEVLHDNVLKVQLKQKGPSKGTTL